MPAAAQEPQKIDLSAKGAIGDKAEAHDSAGPKAGPPGSPMGHNNMPTSNSPYMPLGFNPFMYHPYMNPAGMMYAPYPDPWFMPPMGMPMHPGCSYGKGGSAWGGGRGGPHGGGKGGAGRGQRGSPACGNSSGKGRHHQQKVLPQSTVQMDVQWKDNWKKKLECHEKKDTDDHTKDVQALLDELNGHVWEASTHKEGCMVVQLVMLHCKMKDWPLLCKELHGIFWEAVEHPQADFVLQTLIEAAPGPSCKFIIEECMDKAVDLAKHRYGCRIICRIAEHCLGDDHAMLLIQRVLDDTQVVAGLCCHNFGHHVMQQVMEKGSPDHRKMIANVLSTDLIKMAQSRHASYIIEAAFEFCEEDEKSMLKTMLLKERHIVDFAKHQFGGFVVKKLGGKEEDEEDEEQDEDVDEGGAEAFKKETQQEVRKLLKEHETELINDKNGKKVWEDVFPAKGGQDLSEHEDCDKGPP